MAKLKRYDLYEGDDDIISDPLPGKKPLGRDEGLKFCFFLTSGQA